MGKLFSTPIHQPPRAAVAACGPRGAQSLVAAFLILLSCLLLRPSASALADSDEALQLAGRWYLLVHYTDAEAPDPEALYWEDRIWQLGLSGRRLLWSEHPRVHFRDSSGRRERLHDGSEGRSAGAWEPSATQLDEIREGLELEDQGARSKSLIGSPGQGFSSAGALRSDSVSVIGYHETWRIDDVTTLPVFSRSDAMGSARTEALAGATRYATREILADGDELRGVFERDGALRGRFRMLRMGVPSSEASGTAPQGREP